MLLFCSTLLPFFFLFCFGYAARLVGSWFQPELLWWECQVQTAGLAENLRPQGVLIGESSPGGPHLSTKTQLHLTAYKLQCWMPQVKQPAREEHSPTHQKKKKKR